KRKQRSVCEKTTNLKSELREVSLIIYSKSIESTYFLNLKSSLKGKKVVVFWNSSQKQFCLLHWYTPPFGEVYTSINFATGHFWFILLLLSASKYNNYLKLIQIKKKRDLEIFRH